MRSSLPPMLRKRRPGTSKSLTDALIESATKMRPRRAATP
jgi:hypothetical protein